MSCIHSNTIFDRSDEICEDCGFIIDSTCKLSTTDIRRCSLQKVDNKHIIKDIKNLKLDANIIETANKLYANVIQGKIYRGKHRKSIIYACIFQAYKRHGIPQSCENLLNELKITRKMGNEGLYILNKSLPKDSDVRNQCVTSKDIIIEYATKYKMDKNQIKNILDFYEKIKTKSFINQSKPKSIAASIIYYCIRKNVSIKEFSADLGVSSLTIKAIIKKIEQ